MVYLNELVRSHIDISVAIPTYNGAERLPKILEKLLLQTGVENIHWEIIVVDNNSIDDTKIIVQQYQKKFNNICPLKYFLETKQGAAFARLRGVREAQGKFVAFLDDDNLPVSDWLAAADTFGKEHPQAGAWSGQIHGEFEVKPPQNFERIQAFLAIREHGNQPQLFDPVNLKLPPGAALVVNKQAWCDSVPNELVFSGRLGKSMVGGEDLEPLLYIHKAGWQIWYNPKMHTYHQIPSWRLEKKYLINLARGCGLSTCELRFINAKKWQKPIIFFRTIIGGLRRLVQHIVKYNFNIKNNLIVTCEMQFYFSIMISPFYSLKYHTKNLLTTNKHLTT
ncbi:glycosyltransferase family 2 protein [Anabaena minutissima FACHB-250]|nr:glycosyltransferase family 2 protein [Anabaena minutissima FACHB-250]